MRDYCLLREARSIVEFRLEETLAELGELQIRVCGCKDGAEKWAETVHKAIRELDSLHPIIISDQRRFEVIQLHHGDCLEVLKTLPDNSVDAIGIEKETEYFDTAQTRIKGICPHDQIP